YALSRAWQEIPASTFVSLVDTVKTRILQLALELKDELGLVNDHAAELPKSRIDNHVTNIIFGGNNIIAGKAHDFAQMSTITVTCGDLKNLGTALKSIGLGNDDIAALKTALEQDGAETSEDYNDCGQ